MINTFMVIYIKGSISFITFTVHPVQMMNIILFVVLIDFVQIRFLTNFNVNLTQTKVGVYPI